MIVVMSSVSCLVCSLLMRATPLATQARDAEANLMQSLLLSTLIKMISTSLKDMSLIVNDCSFYYIFKEHARSSRACMTIPHLVYCECVGVILILPAQAAGQE